MTGICSSVCPISEDMICMVGLSDILRTVRRQAEQVVLRHRLWRVHGLLVLWLRGQRQSLREPGAVRPAVRGFQGAGQSVLGLGAIMLYPFAAFPIKRLLLRYKLSCSCERQPNESKAKKETCRKGKVSYSVVYPHS